MDSLWSVILAVVVIVTLIEVAKNVLPSLPTLLEACADRIRDGRQNPAPAASEDSDQAETGAGEDTEDELAGPGESRPVPTATTRRTPVAA